MIDRIAFFVGIFLISVALVGSGVIHPMWVLGSIGIGFVAVSLLDYLKGK